MLDPNAAIALRPVEIRSPMESYTRALSMKQLIQGGKVQDEQLRAAEMANKEREQQMADQEAARAIFARVGPNLRAALPELAKVVSPNTLLAFQKADQEYNQRAASIEASRRPGVILQNQQTAALVAKAMKLPPDQYRVQYPALAAEYRRINPEAKISDQPMPQEQLAGLAFHMDLEKQYLADAEETRKKTEETRKATAETSRVAKEPAVLAEAKAKADVEQYGLVARTMAGANGQLMWTQRREFLSSRISPELLGQVPLVYSAENAAAVRSLGVAPKESIVTGRQDTLAQLKAAGIRIDPATEKNYLMYGEGAADMPYRQAALAISQAHLDLAKKQAAEGHVLTPGEANTIYNSIQLTAKSLKEEEDTYKNVPILEMTRRVAQMHGLDLDAINRSRGPQSPTRGAGIPRPAPPSELTEESSLAAPPAPATRPTAATPAAARRVAPAAAPPVAPAAQSPRATAPPQAANAKYAHYAQNAAGTTLGSNDGITWYEVKTGAKFQ